jgi:hypothetical protein
MTDLLAPFPNPVPPWDDAMGPVTVRGNDNAIVTAINGIYSGLTPLSASVISSGTFGSAIPDTGIYSFPSQIGVGGAGVSTAGIQITPGAATHLIRAATLANFNVTSAGAGTFGSTLGVMGDLTVGASKFVVTASTGSTSLAGQIVFSGNTGASAGGPEVVADAPWTTFWQHCRSAALAAAKQLRPSGAGAAAQHGHASRCRQRHDCSCARRDSCSPGSGPPM